MYASTGDVAERVAVPELEPPSDAGEFMPDPELSKGFKVNVAAGLSAVEPSKVISGSSL